MQPIKGVVPRGSSWMMLIGGVVLLVGVVLAGWLPLSPSPAPTVRTLDPGESIVTELSAEAGDLLFVVINVRDPDPGVSLRKFVQSPSGHTSSAGGSGGFSGWTLARETGIYTIIIQNTGRQAFTIDYRVTITSRIEMTLTAVGPTVVIAGFFLIVGGLGLRFAWRGLRGYWES